MSISHHDWRHALPLQTQHALTGVERLSSQLAPVRDTIWKELSDYTLTDGIDHMEAVARYLLEKDCHIPPYSVATALDGLSKANPSRRLECLVELVARAIILSDILAQGTQEPYQ